MRRSLLLLGASMVLLAALVVAWNHRYERMPGSAVLTLKEFQKKAPVVEGVEWRVIDGETQLLLSKKEQDPVRILELPLEAPQGCKAIHLRYQLQAHRLKRGRNDWDDGRFNVVWETVTRQEAQQVSSVVGEMKEKCSSIISVGPPGGSNPKLSILHLGVSGDYQVTGVEVIFLQEKSWWVFASSALSVIFGIWLMVLLKSMTSIKSWRIALAAMILLLVFLVMVVPGPWILKSPLASRCFDLGVPEKADLADPVNVIAPPVVNHESNKPLAAIPSLPTNELGQHKEETGVKSSSFVQSAKPVEIQNNLILNLKDFLKSFKVILHAIFFAGVAFCLILLIGRRPAIWICAILAILTELAQIAFGYGSDWTDGLDLFFDGVGIGVGCVAAGWLAKVWKRGRVFNHE